MLSRQRRIKLQQGFRHGFERDLKPNPFLGASALHESAAGVNLLLQPVSSSEGGNEQERHDGDHNALPATAHTISVANLIKQEMMPVSNEGGAGDSPAASLYSSLCLRTHADHFIIINSQVGKALSG